MAGEKEFQLVFGVDITEMIAGMQEATATVSESALKMKESVAAVSEGFGKVSEAIVALTAIAAGGSAFGEMIQSTVKLNVDSYLLGKQFGVSATQASVMGVAVKDAYLTQDQLSAAGQRLTRTLNSNEQSIKDMGVETRNTSTGNLRPLLDIMLDVNAVLLKHQEGTDRDVEATKAYGRGWQQFSEILRLSKEGMEEAAITARDLNLAVSEQSEAGVKRYRTSMVDLKAVLEGVSNTIGEAFLPTLSSIGEWFKEYGPTVIDATKIALVGLGTAFFTLKGAIEQVVDLIKGLLNALYDTVKTFVVSFVDGFDLAGNAITLFKDTVGGAVDVVIVTLQTLARVAVRAIHLDWDGAQSEWAAGIANINAAVKEGMTRIKSDSQALNGSAAVFKADWIKGNQDIKDDFSGMWKAMKDDADKEVLAISNMMSDMWGPKDATKAPPAGAAAQDPNNDDKKMKEYESELTAYKQLYSNLLNEQGIYGELSKAAEEQFWTAKLSAAQKGSDLYAAINQKLYTVTQEVRKEAFESEINELKNQEAIYSKDAATRVGIAQQEMDLIAKTYAAGTPQFDAAQKHLIETQRQAAEQADKIAEIAATNDEKRQTDAIDRADAAAKEKYSKGMISVQQLIALEQMLEDKKTEILADGVRRRIAESMKENDPEKLAELVGQLDAIYLAHQNRMTEIDQQATAKRDQIIKQFTQTVESQMTSAFEGIIKGTETVTQAMRKFFVGVAGDIVNSFAQTAAHYIAINAQKWIIEQVQGKAATTAQTATDQVATSKKIANITSVQTAQTAATTAMTTAETTANATSIASSLAMSIQEILYYAAVASAGAFAATAPIPYVGPELAPAAAASAYTTVSAMTSLLSAEGGADIPAGINPLLQAHAKEMVLPAPIADTVRGAMSAYGSSGGGNSGGGGSGGDKASTAFSQLLTTVTNLKDSMIQVNAATNTFRNSLTQAASPGVASAEVYASSAPAAGASGSNGAPGPSGANGIGGNATARTIPAVQAVAETIRQAVVQAPGIAARSGSPGLPGAAGFAAATAVAIAPLLSATIKTASAAPTPPALALPGAANSAASERTAGLTMAANFSNAIRVQLPQITTQAFASASPTIEKIFKDNEKSQSAPNAQTQQSQILAALTNLNKTIASQGTAPAGGGNLTLNVNAIDSKSFEKTLNDNSSSLYDALQKASRSGRGTPRGPLNPAKF